MGEQSWNMEPHMLLKMIVEIGALLLVNNLLSFSSFLYDDD